MLKDRRGSAGSEGRSAPIKILDAGCADGDRTRTVGDMLGQRGLSISSYGVDMSSEMVRLAAKRIERAQVGDLRELPFKDTNFDAVTCLDCHLQDLW